MDVKTKGPDWKKNSVYLFICFGKAFEGEADNEDGDVECMWGPNSVAFPPCRSNEEDSEY